MVNLFINVYIYLGTRWHNHTGSMTEFWKYASFFLRNYSILVEICLIVVERLFVRMLSL